MTKDIVTPPHLDEDLKALRLPTFRGQWERLADQARRVRQSHGEYLAELAHAEVTLRREKGVTRRIQDAKFPVLKTLDAFDFASARTLASEHCCATPAANLCRAWQPDFAAKPAPLEPRRHKGSRPVSNSRTTLSEL